MSREVGGGRAAQRAGVSERRREVERFGRRAVGPEHAGEPFNGGEQ
jgi:hypothetical protein